MWHGLAMYGLFTLQCIETHLRLRVGKYECSVLVSTQEQCGHQCQHV